MNKNRKNISPHYTMPQLELSDIDRTIKNCIYGRLGVPSENVWILKNYTKNRKLEKEQEKMETKKSCMDKQTK